MKRITFLLAISLLIFIGCKKEETEQNAILKWTGEYSVDGCGFFIEFNGEIYKPNNEDNIGEIFKEESSSIVIVDYKLQNKDIECNCGDLPETQKEKSIEIISIKMKLLL